MGVGGSVEELTASAEVASACSGKHRSERGGERHLWWTKVEEDLKGDAARLPAGRGSVRGSRTTSRNSWAQQRGEGVAVAVVVLIGGGGRVRLCEGERQGRG